MLAGIERLADAEGMHASRDLLVAHRSIVHGTTTADNTMIQMSGAPTGLLVTEGFRDEIEFRRCYKEDIWDPALPAPEPIARRRVRLEVAERLTAEGEIDTPLDEEQVRKRDRDGCARSASRRSRSCFLHSYLNPVHELRAREIVLDEYPGRRAGLALPRGVPKPPEFERTSTTLVNAYVGPPIVRYLDRLTSQARRQRLRPRAAGRDLRRAASRPRTRSAAAPLRRSGPGRRAASSPRRGRPRDAGLGDVVSVDMGGTSYDVCLIRDGRPEHQDATGTGSTATASGCR